MDRTDEFVKLVDLFVTNAAETTGQDHTQKLTSPANKIVTDSRIITVFQRVSSNIGSNEALVKRMEKLSTRKEFSNDPTVEMSEISDLFHLKVGVIQKDFDLLKQLMDGLQQGFGQGQQLTQHYKLMMQTLNKRHVSHVEAFKSALKVHSEHIKIRQQRVNKYGQGMDQVRAGTMMAIAGSSGASSSAAQTHTQAPSSSLPAAPAYAMFSAPIKPAAVMTDNVFAATQELRRRGAPAGSAVASGTGAAAGDGAGAGAGASHGPGGGFGWPGATDKSSNPSGKPASYVGNSSSSAGAGGKRFFGAYSSNYAGSGQGQGQGQQGYIQMQVQMQPTFQDTRLKSAQKVEKTIAQVRKLITST
jgi:hypothetical protein